MSIDRAGLLALNNAHAAETSYLTPERLDALLAASFHVGVVDEGRTAFLIAMDAASAYDGVNYHWFRARWERFSYVDRVVTAPFARGRGLARGLYTALFAASRQAGHTRVGCEVNLAPPNPASDAFHASLGFIAIGRAAFGEGRVVRYLEHRLVDG